MRHACAYASLAYKSLLFFPYIKNLLFLSYKSLFFHHIHHFHSLHENEVIKASLLNMASSINLSENDIPGASLFGQKPEELKNEELKFLCFASAPASPYGLAFMQHLLRQPL